MDYGPRTTFDLGVGIAKVSLQNGTGRGSLPISAMGRKAREKAETRLSMTALDADARYDREITSTSAGRQSLSMRRQAAALRARRRFDQAHTVVVAMGALFDESDESAAASAVWHDLACSFSERLLGVPLDNLNAGVVFAQRALRCTSRASVDPRRIQTERQLATLLRARARLSSAEGRAADLADAERLLRRALATAHRIGTAGKERVPGLQTNLANLLRERGDLAGAIEAYELAMAAFISSGRNHEATATALVNLADTLLERSKAGDKGRAETLFSRAIALSVPGPSDRACVALARMLLTRRDVVAAREAIDRVRWDHVPPDLIVNEVAILVRELGDPESARQLLVGVIETAMRDRAGTVADYAADWAILIAQRAAALAARFDCEDGQALRAFLILENTSGLRFGEALRDHYFSPETALEKACLERMQQQGTLAGFIELFREAFLSAPAESRFDLIAEMHANEAADPEWDRFLGILADAGRSPSPETALRRSFERAFEEASIARELLTTRSESFRRTESLVRDQVDERAVREVLERHPGYTLLRVSISSDDLLAIGAWLEDGAVRFASTRFGLPSSSLGDLGQMDLSSALPSGKLEAVVLLPSLRALQLPLIAFGPVGQRLVDRATAVIWLPCLMPLRGQPANSPPRSGEVVLIGPDTHLGEVAFGEVERGQRRLVAESATPAALVEAGAVADVVSVYAHGEWDALPSLLLTDGRLGPEHVGVTWRGLERIELFACSSGLARPLDPRAPLTDDGLGLDFEFLRVGVRSAVGAMWPVPEISTAAICRRYRSLLKTMTPPEALLAAQRWWATTGIEELGSEFENAPSLGPIATEHGRDLSLLARPLAWAGLRFVGVSGVKPPFVVDTAPTKEARAELDGLITSMRARKA